MKTFQSRLPLILSATLVTSLIGIVTVRFREWDAQTRAGVLVLIAAYLGWLVIESRVAVKELDKGTTSLDKGTLELYAFGRALTMLTAVALGRPDLVRGAIGLVIFLGSVAFRLIAIRELGAFYSHRVRIAGGHSVVSTGPYRFVRHPAYTGMILAHAGIVVFFYHPAAVASLLIVLVPAIVLRVRVEEKALMNIDGYPAYSAGRPRLFPNIW